MSLLPTVSDVKNAIARLACGDIVRVYTQTSGNSTDMNSNEALCFLGMYTWEVVQVDQKAIVMRNASGTKFTFTFHRVQITQIGIEALS